MENTVTITIKRYDELRGKEAIYDYLRREAIRSDYTTDAEKSLFDINHNAEPADDDF